MDSEFGGLTELCLAGQDLTELSLVEYGSSIRKIDLSYNMIGSLRGLHVCADTLEELILDNNMLERLDFRAHFPNLHTLSLNKNRIQDMDSLIQELKNRVINLRHISLLGNPICPDRLSYDTADEKDYQHYRHYLLHHLPNLRFVDSRPVLFQELKESRKAKYLQVANGPTYTPFTNGVVFHRYSTPNGDFAPAATRAVPIAAPFPHQSTGMKALPRQGSLKNHCHDIHEVPPGAEGGGGPSTSNGHSENPDSRRSSSSSGGSSNNHVSTKGKVGKRRFRYVGKHSEGNRFIVDSDL